MQSNFVGYIIAFVVGAAVPIFLNWLERREKRKQFGLERKDKYKLVAVEKRLEAHQRAFYHWGKLSEIIHEPDIENRNIVLLEARKFFFENSLYLEKKTRQEFYITINRVSNYPNMISIWKHSKDGPAKIKAYEELMKDWEAIQDLPKIIQNDVELEPIKMEIKVKPEGKGKELSNGK